MSHIRLVSDKGRQNDWYVNLHLGLCNDCMGAGYKGGCTLFLTWNCVDRKNMYHPRKRLQFGVTRNWNRLPWTRH